MDPEKLLERRRRARDRIEREGKYCRGPCQRLRVIGDFAEKEAAIDGRQSWCRDCTLVSGQQSRERNPTRRSEVDRARYAKDPEKNRAQVKAWRDSHPEKWKDVSLRSQRVTAWASNLVSHCRYRSRLRDWPAVDFDGAFVLDLFERQRGLCFWLGIPMVPSVETRDPRRPSLDRLDPALGYVRGNVVLATSFANLGRSTLDSARFAAFVGEMKAQIRDFTPR